jgi:hypothetical protein
MATPGKTAAAGDAVENFSRAPQLPRPRLRIQVDMQGDLAIMASMSASALLAKNPHPAASPPPLRIACQ